MRVTRGQIAVFLVASVALTADMVLVKNQLFQLRTVGHEALLDVPPDLQSVVGRGETVGFVTDDEQHAIPRLYAVSFRAAPIVVENRTDRTFAFGAYGDRAKLLALARMRGYELLREVGPGLVLLGRK